MEIFRKVKLAPRNGHDTNEGVGEFVSSMK